MTESAWPLLVYGGIALLVVLAVLFGSARLVSAAKKGNVKFKWGMRSPREPR